MKKRLLLTSVLSIVMAISLIAGATFALFTSESQVNIAVSSGTVKVTATVDQDVELYSFDVKQNDAFANGGNAVVDGAKLSLNKMTPGDKAIAQINVKNDSDVNIAYRVKYAITGELASALTVSSITEDANGDYIYDSFVATSRYYQVNAYGDIESFKVAVELPKDVGNEMQTKSATLTFTVEAVQANAIYVLPEGVTEESFGDNAAATVGADGSVTYYSTVKAALEGLHGATATFAASNSTNALYFKPSANIDEEFTHMHVCKDLIVYGNQAKLTKGERDFEVDMYKQRHNGKECVGITSDLNLEINALHGVAVWGQRNTEHKVNVTVNNCLDMNRVYISGTSGDNNITVKNCSFDGSSPCSIYSNANGTINVVNTTFTNVGQPINLNHKVAGTQNVNISGCDFVNCGNVSVDTSAWAVAIRVLSSAEDATSVLNVSDVTFTGAKGYKVNGDILLNDTITSTTVSGTVSATLDVPEGTIVTKFAGSTSTGNVETVEPTPTTVTVTKNKEEADAAFKAAKDDTKTDISVIVLPSGNYVIPDTAQGENLVIIGSGDTAIATQDDGSYEGCDYSLDGATVTFENITITTNSATYTGYARLKATYNNCTINGTFTLYDNSTFNNCTFNVSGDVYNIWTWGASNATFNNCTFNSDGKALLLYGGTDTKLTINNCTFNDNGGLADKKAAIEVGSDWTTDKKEIVVINTTVNGYEINDKGINTGTTLWGNKNSLTQERLNVVVDGVDVY